MLWQMVINEEREEAAIETLIETAREFGGTDEDIIKKLISKFGLSKDEAKECVEEYDKSLQPV